MSIAPDIMVHPRPALPPARGSVSGSEAGKSAPVAAAPRPAQPEEPAWMREQMAAGEADAHGFRQPNGEEQDLGFFDLLDVINPLQHLPVVGGIYRQITGDQMSPAAHAAGGFLWGGPLSLLAGAMNGAMEEETGKDMMGTMLAWLEGDSPADLPPGSELGTVTDAAGITAANGQQKAETDQTAQTAQTTMTATAAAESDPNDFRGAAANRLDAFIRANGNPQTAAQNTVRNTAPGALSPAAMDAMAIRQSLRLDIDTADLRDAGTARRAPSDAPTLANRTPVSGPATAPGSVGSWMTQALDQYDTMKADPAPEPAVGRT
ncbi:MAG: hypothetical protein NXI19_03440 [Alphaproteobacteria bacterium]|nr:hypothetical protein [Alphaproteobacteria bacterium]